MSDAKTQVSVSGRSRITADQEHEVSNLAQKYGLSKAPGTDLPRRQRPRKTQSSLRPLSLQYALGQRWLLLTEMKSSPQEALVRARIAVDQVRLSRLATQNAIERNRQSLTEIKTLLAALRDAKRSSAWRMKVQRRIDAMKLRQVG
jgi:hypothetical protein